MRFVRVMDTTAGVALAERAEVAESFLNRFIGLQGRNELPSGAGLVLIPTNSIHMFFMRFPIDAIFVDSRNTVTKVGRSLRPWTIGPLALSALYCIELPAGAADAVRAGHLIELQPLNH